MRKTVTIIVIKENRLFLYSEVVGHSDGNILFVCFTNTYVVKQWCAEEKYIFKIKGIEPTGGVNGVW